MLEAAPATFKLALYTPPHLAMSAVDGFHAATGMPYWMTIVAITLAIRTAILPVGVLSARNAARTAAMKPEMDLLQEAIKVMIGSSCGFESHSRKAGRAFLLLRLLLLRLPLLCMFPRLCRCSALGFARWHRMYAYAWAWLGRSLNSTKGCSAVAALCLVTLSTMSTSVLQISAVASRLRTVGYIKADGVEQCGPSIERERVEFMMPAFCGTRRRFSFAHDFGQMQLQ